MANIPVERSSSGIPWWVWLLGLLALLAIGLLLFAGDDDEYVDTVDPVEQPVVVDDDPFEDDPMIADENDLNLAIDELVAAGAGEGREVMLNGVEVLRVVGDSSFVIDTAGRETLVILAGLGESETGAGGSDGRFNVDEGDMISISGAALTRYRDNMPGTSEMSDEDRAMAMERQGTLTVREASNITVEG